MRIVYKPKNYLSHSLTAEQQRERYDSQARHERYIRDRDAGKTGYQGIQGKGTTAPSYSTQNQQESRVIAKRTNPTTAPSYASGRHSISRYGQRKRPQAIQRQEPSNPIDRTIYQIRQQIDSLRGSNLLDVSKNKEAIKRNLAMVSKNIQSNIDRVQAILDSRKRSK